MLGVSGLEQIDVQQRRPPQRYVRPSLSHSFVFAFLDKRTTSFLSLKVLRGSLKNLFVLLFVKIYRKINLYIRIESCFCFFLPLNELKNDFNLQVCNHGNGRKAEKCLFWIRFRRVQK